MNNVTWEWLAGFTDGEGCFSLTRKPAEGVSGETFQPKIKVYQNGESGRLILNLIRSFAGFGSVAPDGRWIQGRKEPYSWSVFGCDNVIRLCEAIHSRLVVKYRQCLLLYLYARSHIGCRSNNGEAKNTDHFIRLVLTCALNTRGTEDASRISRIERSTGLKLSAVIAQAERLITDSHEDEEDENGFEPNRLRVIEPIRAEPVPSGEPVGTA